MTMAWYGHLKFKDLKWFENLGLISIVLISWGIAFFEYIFQVPANRIGFRENGGPFSLVELKVLQEVITLVVFMIFTLVFFFVYYWFREQACIIVCPYGRLQGVLLDRNSILVAYDYVRGEPRGKLSDKTNDKGDCVNCHAREKEQIYFKNYKKIVSSK